MVQGITRVLLCTTQYYASITLCHPVLQRTTLCYKVLRQYYNVLLPYYSRTTPVLLPYFSVLQSTTQYYNVLLQYYSELKSITPVLQGTTPILQRTTRYYNSLLQYYSVLQSATPGLQRTTQNYSVLLQYYKLPCQYYSVLPSSFLAILRYYFVTSFTLECNGFNLWSHRCLILEICKLCRFVAGR